MKKALRDLFSSKKFLVMLASIVAYAAARAGFDVSQAEAEKVLGLAAVWLGAQGLADLGKSKSLGDLAGLASEMTPKDPAS